MPEHEFDYPQQNEEPEKEKDPKVLDIVEYPDPILRQVAEPVPPEQFRGKGSKELKKLVNRMFATVDHYEGIGLAAPQVGASFQLFVTTIGPSPDELQEAFEAEEKRWEDEKIEINSDKYKSELQTKVLERIVAQSRRVFINPEILEREGETVDRERCLSLPNISASVKRSLRIKLRALDLNGESFELEAEGLEARCFKHEYDHLHATLISDHSVSMERTLNDPKLKRLAREHRRKNSRLEKKKKNRRVKAH
jgi:peptide deformylase